MADTTFRLVSASFEVIGRIYHEDDLAKVACMGKLSESAVIFDRLSDASVDFDRFSFDRPPVDLEVPRQYLGYVVNGDVDFTTTNMRRTLLADESAVMSSFVLTPSRTKDGPLATGHDTDLLIHTRLHLRVNVRVLGHSVERQDWYSPDFYVAGALTNHISVYYLPCTDGRYRPVELGLDDANPCDVDEAKWNELLKMSS